MNYKLQAQDAVISLTITGTIWGVFTNQKLNTV